MARSKREYTWARTAWPASVWNVGERDVVDDINLTIHGSGFSADFSIKWYMTGTQRDEKPTPRVEAFGDSWKGLEEVAWILAKLDDKNPTPEEVITELSAAGWVPSEYHGQLSQHRKMAVSSLQRAAEECDKEAVDELARRLLAQ